MFNEAVLWHPAELSGWMKKKGGDVMAIDPKHMKKRYCVLKGSNLFYFKAEAAGGTNTPAGSPLSVIPLEFSLLEAEGQPTETASGKPIFALSLKVSPEFWPRSKHKSYLFGLKSQEAQTAWACALREASVPRPNLLQSISDMGSMEAALAQHDNVVRIHHLKTPTFAPKPASAASRLSMFRPRASQAAMAAAPQRHVSIFAGHSGSDFKPANARLSLSDSSEDGNEPSPPAPPPRAPCPAPRSPTAPPQQRVSYAAPPAPPPRPPAPPPPPPMSPPQARPSGGPLVKPSDEALQAEIARRKSRMSGVGGGSSGGGSFSSPPSPAKHQPSQYQHQQQQQQPSSGRGFTSSLKGMFSKKSSAATDYNNSDGLPTAPLSRTSPAVRAPPASPPPPPQPRVQPPPPSPVQAAPFVLSASGGPAPGPGGLIKPTGDALKEEIARRASRKSENQQMPQAQVCQGQPRHAPVQIAKRVVSRGGSFNGSFNSRPLVPQGGDFSSELQNALQSSQNRRASKDAVPQEQTTAEYPTYQQQQQQQQPQVHVPKLKKVPSSNYTPPHAPSYNGSGGNDAYYSPYSSNPSTPRGGQSPGHVLGINKPMEQHPTSSPTSTLTMHQQHPQKEEPHVRSPAKNFMDRLQEINNKSGSKAQSSAAPSSRVGDVVIGVQPWKSNVMAPQGMPAPAQRKSSTPADLLGIPSQQW